MEKSKQGWFADVKPREEGKAETLATIPVELQNGYRVSDTEWGCYPDAESVRALNNWLDGAGEKLASCNMRNQQNYCSGK